jgi:hypothetical protein
MTKRRIVNTLYLTVVLSVLVEYSIEANPINVNLPNIFILILASATAYDFLKIKSIDLNFLKLFFACSALLIFSASSLRVEVGNSTEHIRLVITLTKGATVLLVITYWVGEYVDLKKISDGLVWAGVIAFLGVLAQSYSGFGGGLFAGRVIPSRLPEVGLNLGVYRSSGFLGGYGLLGIYLESAALLSAIGFLSHGRRQGWTIGFAVLGVVVAFVGLLCSQSRSGLVATLVGYGVFYTLATLVYSQFSVVRMVPIVLIIGAMIYAWTELMEFLIGVHKNAVVGRVKGYWAAAKAIGRDPILGVGFSNMEPKLNYYRSVHNSYLNLFAGGGGVAFALYVYLNWKATKEGVLCLKASDPRAPLAIGLLSALSAAMVECMFWGGGAFATTVFILLGLLIALGRVAYQHS